MSIWSVLLWQPVAVSTVDLGNTLLASISKRWAEDPYLFRRVRFNRVFTGRVPDTERYRFPYVSIKPASSSVKRRSDKTTLSYVTVNFHVWVSPDDLAHGERIAEAISDAYANRCWECAPGLSVMDVIDEGPPIAEQVDEATIKAWDVIQMLTLVVQRDHIIGRYEDCCTESGSSFSSSAMFDPSSSNSSSNQQSSSSGQ